MSPVTRGYRANLAALAAAQKPSRGTAAYSRFVNRPLARHVAALAHALHLTPNQATAVSATLSFAGLAVLALARPTLPAAFAVAALLAAGYVLDSVDGQLARLRGGGSVSGEWLDHTVDCVKTASLHLCVLVSWYRFPPVADDRLLIVPLVFEVVAMATYFGLVVMPLIRKERGYLSANQTATTAEHPLKTWLLLPSDYGLLCWVFVLLAWPSVFATVYTGLLLLYGALLVLAARKWWGELREMDRGR